MKPTIFLTGVVMVFLSALFACQKHYEDTPQFEKAGSPDITLSVDKKAVTLVAADSAKTAVTFTWTDPKYQATPATAKFVLFFDKNGNNFSNPTKREFTGALAGVLTGAITTLELNGLALKHAPGQVSAVLDVKVVASLSNNNQPISSTTLQITVTPYSAFTLKPASAALVCLSSNGADTAVTFEWTKAFSGFKGEVTYQFQYAKAGTNFASPVSEDVTTSSKVYTFSQLNTIAVSYGVVALTSGNVEFRVAATNELGAVQRTGISTLSITPLAYASIGIIGDATEGGWDTADSDLYRPDAVGKPAEWEGIFYLTGGKTCKFRADDKWDNNWGGTDFPSGTGKSNGANIPVSTSGYYKVTFNTDTGAYTFTATTDPYASIGIIGDATAGGWDTDSDLYRPDAVGKPAEWEGIFYLTGGKTCKFRADDKWDNRWSDIAFPSGTGKRNGKDILVSTSGYYKVTFNTDTRAYTFTATIASSIGIIGDATAGGQNTDSDLFRPDAVGKPAEWEGIFYLTSGKTCKFRADDKGDNNWSDAAFPSGTGKSNGPGIPVSTSGYYKVTFNADTRAYTFTAITVPTVSSVALTGEQFKWSTSGFALTQSTADPNIFTGTTQLEAKNVKFLANNAWTVNWGGKTFPSGYGTQNGENIYVAAAGRYFIYLNIATGEYFFSPDNRGTPYSVVGIVGSATANGWNTDTALIQNPSMKFRYSATVTLKNGAAKFRADGNWDVNWGASTFPGGTGVSRGSDIPVKEGTYVVHFHTATGEYSFSKLD